MIKLTRRETRAEHLGALRAEQEIKAGAEGPSEAPLSGEFSDDLTPSRLMVALGLNPGLVSDWLTDACCDAYEQGYFQAWGARPEP